MGTPTYRLFFRRLAEQWQLTEEEYYSLVALGPEALPQLLLIESTLQQLFAGSPRLAELWMTSPNKGLGNETPMALVAREGMAGLEKVATFLCLD